MAAKTPQRYANAPKKRMKMKIKKDDMVRSSPAATKVRPATY